MSRCPESELVPQSPPLVFDLEKDPKELDKMDSSEADIREMLEKVQDLIQEHRKNLIVGEMQNGFWDDSLIPCCDPPKCQCDRLGPEL